MATNWWRRWLLAQGTTDLSGVPGEPALTAAARNAAQLIADLELLDPYELPTVVAARTLCADTTAMMQLVGLAGTDRLDPSPSVLRRPDPGEPYRRTMERIVNGLTRHGRSWLYVDALGSNGYPLAVRYVADDRVNATVDAGGRVTAVQIDGAQVDRRRVVHIPMRQDRDPLGESPLEEIRLALEQLAEVYRYGAGYYTTAGVPPYAVVHPNRLTAGQAQAFADQWLLARAERRPAVLSGGIALETYSGQSAADALLLDAIGYLDQVIARVLLIPPSLLNVQSAGSLTYSTVQGEFTRWLAVGLYPMFLSRIEAAFTDLLPRGQVAVFDTSNLTRMDFPGRIAAYSESIGAGIHTPAEVRALEGLPAAPDPSPTPIAPNVEGL